MCVNISSDARSTDREGFNVHTLQRTDIYMLYITFQTILVVQPNLERFKYFTSSIFVMHTNPRKVYKYSQKHLNAYAIYQAEYEPCIL